MFAGTAPGRIQQVLSISKQNATRRTPRTWPRYRRSSSRQRNYLNVKNTDSIAFMSQIKKPGDKLSLIVL
jgi:hypothetical protein